MADPFRVLSLGAGVQSVTLLLLSEHGVLPRLDAAIFADTQSEPQGVYETLEWLTAATSIPIHRVSKGNLGQDIATVAEAHAAGKPMTAGPAGQPPFFVRNDPNLDYATADSGGTLWRKCTRDYKIMVIRRKVRELLGLLPQGTPRGVRVEQWIGISVEEMQRTVCSEVAWITNIFPLLLPLRMHRRDCVRWLEQHGYPLPMKSSCTFCPYHDNAYWRTMRDERPAEWAATVAFEARLQAGKLPGVRGKPYLHRSLVPLPLAPIDAPDTGQEELFCMACHT
jgi:hypothetical protein